jgi:hypothetical protein
MTEEQMQAQCFQWHWNTYPKERGMLHHNNNNSVNRITGNRVKALGVVKGVSDFELVVTGAVIFIEMKTDIGRLSAEQEDFRNKVISKGHIYIVVRNISEFQQLILSTYGTLGDGK